jgi:hypothetical protein
MEEGLFLAGTPLLERHDKDFAARRQADLEIVLSRGFGLRLANGRGFFQDRDHALDYLVCRCVRWEYFVLCFIARPSGWWIFVISKNFEYAIVLIDAPG